MDYVECYIRGFMVDIIFLWIFFLVVLVFDGKKRKKKERKIGWEGRKKGRSGLGVDALFESILGWVFK